MAKLRNATSKPALADAARVRIDAITASLLPISTYGPASNGSNSAPTPQVPGRGAGADQPLRDRRRPDLGDRRLGTFPYIQMADAEAGVAAAERDDLAVGIHATTYITLRAAEARLVQGQADLLQESVALAQRLDTGVGTDPDPGRGLRDRTLALLPPRPLSVTGLGRLCTLTGRPAMSDDLLDDGGAAAAPNTSPFPCRPNYCAGVRTSVPPNGRSLPARPKWCPCRSHPTLTLRGDVGLAAAKSRRSSATQPTLVGRSGPGDPETSSSAQPSRSNGTGSLLLWRPTNSASSLPSRRSRSPSTTPTTIGSNA